MIPFLIMLVVVGMPLLLLELALGQKLRVGAAGAWKKVEFKKLILNHPAQYVQVHPALAGVGYGSTIVATIVGCYYNVIIAWCIFYLGSSFTVSTLTYCTNKPVVVQLPSKIILRKINS